MAATPADRPAGGSRPCADPFAARSRSHRPLERALPRLRPGRGRPRAACGRHRRRRCDPQRGPVEPVGQHPPPGHGLRGDGAGGADPRRDRRVAGAPRSCRRTLDASRDRSCRGRRRLGLRAAGEIVGNPEERKRLYPVLRRTLDGGAAQLLDEWREAPEPVRRALLWLLTVLPELRATHEALVAEVASPAPSGCLAARGCRRAGCAGRRGRRIRPGGLDPWRGRTLSR